MWPFSKRPKPIGILRVPTMQFLGEQDGPVELELKSQLTNFFASKPSVAKAYLCRVRFGDSDSVALALDAPEDPDLAAQIGKVFSQMFNGQSHLDILFLRDEAEADLAKVCPPFYVAG